MIIFNPHILNPQQTTEQASAERLLSIFLPVCDGHNFIHPTPTPGHTHMQQNDEIKICWCLLHCLEPSVGQLVLSHLLYCKIQQYLYEVLPRCGIFYGMLL